MSFCCTAVGGALSVISISCFRFVVVALSTSPFTRACPASMPMESVMAKSRLWPMSQARRDGMLSWVVRATTQAEGSSSAIDVACTNADRRKCQNATVNAIRNMIGGCSCMQVVVKVAARFKRSVEIACQDSRDTPCSASAEGPSSIQLNKNTTGLHGKASNSHSQWRHDRTSESKVRSRRYRCQDDCNPRTLYRPHVLLGSR